MKIGDRIKARREQLGLSQAELAKKLGYKTRSSIAKIETDASGLPQSKIVAIANALDTTPGYIMGWRDEEGKPIEDDPVMQEIQGILSGMTSEQLAQASSLLKWIKSGH